MLPAKRSVCFQRQTLGRFQIGAGQVRLTAVDGVRSGPLIGQGLVMGELAGLGRGDGLRIQRLGFGIAAVDARRLGSQQELLVPVASL